MSTILQLLKDNKLSLGIGFLLFLIISLSYGIGYLMARQTDPAPIIVEKCGSAK